MLFLKSNEIFVRTVFNTICRAVAYLIDIGNENTDDFMVNGNNLSILA